MQPNAVYEFLQQATEKPPPFSVYTADALWTDPHRSERMLAFHLNPDLDVSSRRANFIDESADWIVRHFGLSDSHRVIDFGCGPGLYASRLAATGARATGVDFSPRSIAWAKLQAEGSGLDIDYRQANYLEFEAEGPFDLAMLIMCDFCALGPAQRAALLHRIAGLLGENGRLLFDVYSLPALEAKAEEVRVEENLLGGFFSANRYFGIQAAFRYPDEKVALDKYTIVEEDRHYVIYNWLQHFSPQSLQSELRDNGFAVETLLGDVAGQAYAEAGTEFAVVAKALSP